MLKYYLFVALVSCQAVFITGKEFEELMNDIQKKCVDLIEFANTLSDQSCETLYKNETFIDQIKCCGKVSGTMTDTECVIEELKKYFPPEEMTEIETRCNKFKSCTEDREICAQKMMEEGKSCEIMKEKLAKFFDNKKN